MTYLQRYFYKVPPEDQLPSAIAFYAALDNISTTAPSIVAAILQELKNQCSCVKLIASENYCSLAVQQAMGNLLTDKYAEGTPFHRFYAGCENIDAIEAEAVLDLKLLFNADHAYVQPHSGADANLIAFWAILLQRVQKPELEKLGKKNINELSEEEYERIRQLMTNQKVLGMSLGAGGHLTHGYRHNISGKMIRSSSYGVDPQTGFLDYDKLAEQVKSEKPDIFLAGYSAYPRRLNFARLKEIADSVGATFMVDMAHFAGLVAGRLFIGEEDPIPFADIITSTTHKTLRGPRGGIILCKKEYQEVVDKGCPLVMGGPLPHVIAAKAVAFKEASAPTFREYAELVVNNSQALAEKFLSLGAPLLTGGTDNHLLVVDVRPFGLTGYQAELALRRAGLTVNRNAIPQDPNGPWYASGLRIGTPAVSTLGMGHAEMQMLGSWIHQLLTDTAPVGRAKIESSKLTEKIKGEVGELLRRFPLYPELEVESWTEKEQPISNEA